MLVLFRAQGLCESRGGRPGPSQIVLMVSVDVEQHLKKKSIEVISEAVWKSRWTSWASPSLIIVLVVCRRKATLEKLVLYEASVVPCNVG